MVRELCYSAAVGLSHTTACRYVRKHVGQKDFSTLLAAKKPAGVAPEMSLRNPLHAGNKAHKCEFTLTVKPRTDITRCPKQDISAPLPTKRTYVLHNIRLCILSTFAI